MGFKVRCIFVGSTLELTLLLSRRLKQPLLTIEFTFYPPELAHLPAQVSPKQSPYTVLTHRNQISKTLLEILRSHIPRQPLQSRKQKEKSLPDWVSLLVHPHPEDPEGFILPDCYMHATLDFPGQSNPRGTYYHKLDPTLALSQLLRHAHFVEFPTIHVFDRDASSFRGTVVDKAGRITRDEEDTTSERAPKRKKVDPRAIAGLLGDYGSSSESEDGQVQGKDGLLMLESYSEGGDDKEHQDNDMYEGASDNPEQLSSSDTEEIPIEPERLLELMKRACEAADEDVLDWGDDTEL